MVLTRLVAVVALCTCMAEQTPAQSVKRSADEAKAESQIANLLHDMYEAEKRKDLNFVKAHLAPDFFEVSGDGGIYRTADVEASWSDVTLRSYQLSDCVFQLLAPSVGLMTCKMELDASYKDQPIPSPMRVTTLWQKDKGNWLAVFEQATLMPPAPPK